jgi:hypothetical protein
MGPFFYFISHPTQPPVIIGRPFVVRFNRICDKGFKEIKDIKIKYNERY